MKNFLIFISVLFGLTIPSIVFAQPGPKPKPGYHPPPAKVYYYPHSNYTPVRPVPVKRVKVCYTTMYPFPHSHCEIQYVNYNYYPTPKPIPYGPELKPGHKPHHNTPPPRQHHK